VTCMVCAFWRGECCGWAYKEWKTSVWQGKQGVALT